MEKLRRAEKKETNYTLYMAVCIYIWARVASLLMPSLTPVNIFVFTTCFSVCTLDAAVLK